MKSGCFVTLWNQVFGGEGLKKKRTSLSNHVLPPYIAGGKVCEKRNLFEFTVFIKRVGEKYG